VGKIACCARAGGLGASAILPTRMSADPPWPTLRCRSPYASMLVIASDDEYIKEMLAAFRA
jgi:hypothetical protein